MGRLNRQKCGELLDEFKAYLKAEKSGTDMEELSPDGEALIRIFCEAIAEDEQVGDRFDALLEGNEEQDDSTQTRDSRGSTPRGKNGYKGEERRKKEGGWHMFERRKRAFQYPASAKNDRRVVFARAK
jgi:hypothetical protein